MKAYFTVSTFSISVCNFSFSVPFKPTLSFQLNSNRVSDVEENQAAVDSPEVLETLKDYFQLNYDLEELYDIWATGEDKKEKKVKTDSKIAQSQR